MGNQKGSKKKPNFFQAHKKVIFLAGIPVLLIVIGSFVVFLFFEGYPQYYSSYLKCGHAPVAIAPDFAGGQRYYVMPGDEGYPGPNMFFKYVCTERAAKGYGPHDPSK